MEGVCFPLLLCTAFLLCLMSSSSPKRLHFGHCMVSVDMYEIRKGFGDIKQTTIQDQYTGIQFLQRSYSLQDTKDVVTTCPCGKEANQRYEQLLIQFQRMDSQSAALKALGELDILLDWIDMTD